ncbi:MAG: carbohydrate ABC transporter substrate-binding protein [Lachnospiraceae bacterium]|nr:carbohydrate ABC transporter substrate-binding protein [Lachnospiraceae bacterium]
MKKKALSFLLSAAMTASMLTGCGIPGMTNEPAGGTEVTADEPADTQAEVSEETADDKAEDADTSDDEAGTETGEKEDNAGGSEDEDTDEDGEKETVSKPPKDTGTVLNIYSWNDEFARRMRDHLPGYYVFDPEDAGKGGTYKGITVKFNLTPSLNDEYQNNLDALLPYNCEVADDERIDIFLVEADYALKYVDTGYVMPISELGIDNSELFDQYQYTKDIMTASDGTIRGLTWQGCPGVLIYNREIAKEVLGSDDPGEVQEAVKNWDAWNDTARKVGEKGYKMTATVNDTYRVYSNNVRRRWVENDKIHIDDSIMDWLHSSKALVDNGLTTTAELWSEEWYEGFYPEGGVFCYFGPAWMINLTMDADTEGSIANQGGWGACEGPQSFYWGGSWIVAAAGTDNPSTVAKIMRAMTTDKEIMTDIVKKDSDFVNNKTVIEETSSGRDYAFDALGGQNPVRMFASGAEKLSLSNITEYDQGCNEEFQKAMKPYFDGEATKKEALDEFYDVITRKYPELSY